MKTDYEAMIVTYLDGRTSATENRQLDERLRNDPDLRKRFVATAALTGMLAESVATGAMLPQEKPRWIPKILIVSGVAAAAAAVVLSWQLAAPMPHPAVGVLVGAHGTITIDRDGKPITLAVGADLKLADHLVTAGDGFVSLLWSDGSRTSLAPGSAVLLDAGLLDGGHLANALTLESGEIACDIRHRGAGENPFGVAAGPWRVVDLGTTFTVTMAADGPHAAVSRGAVEVHAGAHTTKILADQNAVADAGGIPRVLWQALAVDYGSAAHPFAATSPWNAVIPPSAARGAALPGFTVPWATTGAGIAVLDGNGEMHEVYSRGTSTVIGTMPEVPGLLPAQVNGVRVMIVIAADGKTAWEAREPELRNDHRIAARHLATVDLTGAGDTGGLLSGLPACAGLITADDLAHGIPHAVALYLPQHMQAAAGVQAGDRLALDEDFVDPGPTDSVAAALCLALRAHGAVVVNAGAAAQIAVDALLPPAQQAAAAAAMTRFAPFLRRLP